MWSSFGPFPGCQGSCGTVPNGPASSVVSFNICWGLKCYHVVSTPNLTMWLLSSHCILSWTIKVVATFRGEMQQLFGCILIDSYATPSSALSPEPEALCWIFWQNAQSFKILKLRILWLWPFCIVIISLTHMLPAWLLALALHMCTFIHINFLCVYRLEQ